MEKVLTELALYDVMAYLVPGLVVVAAGLHGVRAYFRDGAGEWSWSALVAAYLIGHLLQTWASPARDWWWDDRPFSERPLSEVFKDDNQADLREAMQSSLEAAFPLATTSTDRFLFADAYVQARHLDSFTEIMRARYGFFRGLSWRCSSPS